MVEEEKIEALKSVYKKSSLYKGDVDRVEEWSEEETAKAFEDLYIESKLYVGNLQLCTSALCCLVFSLIFLRITRSSIFVVLSVVSYLSVLTVIYIIYGMLAEERWLDEIIAGRYLFTGIGFFIMGIALDKRGHVHYAAPLSVSGLILIVGPLSVIASSSSTLFGWLDIVPDFLLEDKNDPTSLTVEATYLSFAANGLIYLSLASLCRSMRTLLQRRLSQVFNWLGPLHILGALRMLDGEDTYGDDIQHRLLYPVSPCPLPR